MIIISSCSNFIIITTITIINNAITVINNVITIVTVTVIVVTLTLFQLLHRSYLNWHI